MKASIHCTHSDWKALPCDDCLVAYVKWDIGFRLIAQTQVLVLHIWQQNGVNRMSHQRNKERKSSEAKLIFLLRIISLSRSWGALWQRKEFYGKAHFTVSLSLSSGAGRWTPEWNSGCFPWRKKKNAALSMVCQGGGYEEEERTESSFHMMYHFFFVFEKECF